MISSRALNDMSPINLTFFFKKVYYVISCDLLFHVLTSIHKAKNLFASVIGALTPRWEIEFLEGSYRRNSMELFFSHVLTLMHNFTYRKPAYQRGPYLISMKLTCWVLI